MHIFLTGEIQIGKSTVINKTLSLLKYTPGGFRTYFGPDRSSTNRLLYMNSASEPKVYKEENAIAVFTDNSKPKALTERFDTFGVELVRSAQDKEAKLILMDECGRLEREAYKFQAEVLKSLDGDTPILGVIKLMSDGWTDKIKNHPNVRVITVTKENRDELPQILARELNKRIK